MVLGTPDKGLPSKPAEKHVFIEDLNQNQLNKVGMEPSGLVNLREHLLLEFFVANFTSDQ